MGALTDGGTPPFEFCFSCRRMLAKFARLVVLGHRPLLVTEGHAAGTPLVREALAAFRAGENGTEKGLRWLWLAGRTAGFIWDYESWDSLTTQQLRAAREAGALAHLPLALSTRVGVQIFAGETRAAASLVDEADALAEVTYGRIVPPYGRLRWPRFADAKTSSRDWCNAVRTISSPAARDWG
jgi:hypothetical protein